MTSIAATPPKEPAKGEIAQIWTDKGDYVANETVTIYGKNLTRMALVEVKITYPNDYVG
jgi:hypothetical protein